jgi:putative chitobiose transport system permease protein
MGMSKASAWAAGAGGKGGIRRLTPYLFLAPALAVLGLTVFYPAFQAFYLSFTEYDLISPPVWVGGKNFARLGQDPIFWRSLRQTLLYLVCVVPVLVSLPLALAILVNQKLRGIAWFRAAYYVPVVISMIVAGITWKWLFSSNGLLNQLLVGLGIVGQGIPWLTSPGLALFCVMLVTVWKGLGYYMVIYLAGLQGIPADLYEAAALDGYDGPGRHWAITLPLMRPYMVLVAVISAISATKVFEEVFVMTNGGPLYASTTVVHYLYTKTFGGSLEIGYGCAIALVMFMLILTLSALRLSLGKYTDV